MFKIKVLNLWAIALLCFTSCQRGPHHTKTENIVSTAERAEITTVSDTSSVAFTAEKQNTEDYDNIKENDFVAALKNPQSTFSIDVDNAAYSNVRRFIRNGSLPPAGAVRIEEMINYFSYNYAEPASDMPFAVTTEIAGCPWNAAHKLVHIGLKGSSINTANLPAANLVFLVDVSGSMDEENKLPLVKSSMKLLADQLRENDNVAIVVYAGAAGLVLPSTPGSQKLKIKEAIENLQAGGSTAGAEGIQLAYKIAKENFKADGNNRVILATDGDFNVGLSSEDELITLIEKERKTNIFLTVLGFGVGNYKDNKMQQLADKGNGNHGYIDNINEAKKLLVNEFGGTLFTIAKDVKLQVEFNPSKVQSYRLIGYENRILAKEDFNDDQKDAGELGAGHTVTALYEIIPVGVKDEFTRSVDDLKYQKREKISVTETNEIMNIKLRFKDPKGNVSRLITKPVEDNAATADRASRDFRFSAAVASFGMILRNSAYKQNSHLEQVISLAKSSKGNDPGGYREDFIKLVEEAALLTKK